MAELNKYSMEQANIFFNIPEDQMGAWFIEHIEQDTNLITQLNLNKFKINRSGLYLINCIHLDSFVSMLPTDEINIYNGNFELRSDNLLLTYFNIQNIFNVTSSTKYFFVNPIIVPLKKEYNLNMRHSSQGYPQNSITFQLIKLQDLELNILPISY